METSRARPPPSATKDTTAPELRLSRPQNQGQSSSIKVNQGGSRQTILFLKISGLAGLPGRIPAGLNRPIWTGC
jgi:hypothetical protein